MIVYRQHKQPGCGGCLFLLALIMLGLGGAPLLFDFLGMLLFLGIFFIFSLFAIFWGVAYYIRRQISKYEQSQTESHNKFVFLLINILVKIAQTDGSVTRAETTTISNFFRYHLNYSQNQLFWVRDLIKDASHSTSTIEELMAEFKGQFAYEPRLILLELVYQVVFTNEKVSDSELRMLLDVANYLEISPYDHQAIKTKYVGGLHKSAADEDRYYDVLGLKPGVGFEEIKSAYRRLSMQYHPDKVSHLGEEFRKVAEEKMKELNVAYQHLKTKFA